MLNNAVSIGNVMAGRMISGLVALSMDHPFVLACILASIMGLTVAIIVDAVRPRQASAPSAVSPKPHPHSSATCSAGQTAKMPRQPSGEF